jgi:hypothetical protein
MPSPLQRGANDGAGSDQAPAHDETERSGHGLEGQQPRQPRKARREHEAERASCYTFQLGADTGECRADPSIR